MLALALTIHDAILASPTFFVEDGRYHMTGWDKVHRLRLNNIICALRTYVSGSSPPVGMRRDAAIVAINGLSQEGC